MAKGSFLPITGMAIELASFEPMSGNRDPIGLVLNPPFLGSSAFFLGVLSL
jgi:hypothetical protein